MIIYIDEYYKNFNKLKKKNRYKYSKKYFNKFKKM